MPLMPVLSKRFPVVASIKIAPRIFSCSDNKDDIALSMAILEIPALARNSQAFLCPSFTSIAVYVSILSMGIVMISLGLTSSIVRRIKSALPFS